MGAALATISVVGLAASANALECTHPQGAFDFGELGDVNGNGVRNVADVVCAVLATLTVQSGGSLDGVGCLAQGWRAADLSCDGVVNITDVMAGISLTVGLGVPSGLSPDPGTGCPAACEPCAPVGGSSCFIGGACVPQGERAGAGGCQICDPAQDDGAYTVQTCQDYFRDDDDDAFGLDGDSQCACVVVEPYTASQGGDCDDGEPLAYPGNAEVCDGIDNDCSGGADDTFPTLDTACDGDDADQCANGTFTCTADGSGVECVNEAVEDIEESCGNGVDDDCDGETDEGCFVSAGNSSCLSILLRGASTGDGVYTIDPDGEGGNDPFQVYCDMTTDGGGWTRIYGEYEVHHDEYTASRTNNALDPADILTPQIASGALGHLSQVQVNSIPYTEVEDRMGNSGEYYARFSPGAATFDFVTRTTNSGDPPDLAYSYRWGSAKNVQGWALNPDHLLYVPIQGTGVGFFAGYGVRLAGSHDCGSYVSHPADLVRAEYTNGDFFSGCYQPLNSWRSPRTIWVRDHAPPTCATLLAESPGATDGVYYIDPDGEGGADPFEAYCDMTTDGGGWTMCYTERDNMVHIASETTFTGAYGTPGYRTDCRNIPFTDVLYHNHDSGQRAWFTANSGGPFTAAGLGYFAAGNAPGTLFTGHGVASTSWSYQLNVCDAGWMWTGFMITGYSNCYKQCNSWCGDTGTHYYRTDGSDDANFNGVAFKENGHTNVSYKTLSVGIR